MTLFAIILIIAGVFLTIAPNLVYAITQSWKIVITLPLPAFIELLPGLKVLFLLL